MLKTVVLTLTPSPSSRGRGEPEETFKVPLPRERDLGSGKLQVSSQTRFIKHLRFIGLGISPDSTSLPSSWGQRGLRP
jgi:hypothetical protein